MQDHLSNYGSIKSLEDGNLVIIEDMPPFLAKIERIIDEIDRADEDVATPSSLELLTRLDLIYRSLVTIQFNFSQSGHPGGSISAET